MEDLIDAGMTVARFNFSHVDRETHAEAIKNVKMASEKKRMNVATVLDTQGPEVRTGFYKGDVTSVELKKRSTITLVRDFHFPGTVSKVGISYPNIVELVKTGQTLIMSNGEVILTVLSTNLADGTILCRVENDCVLKENVKVNIPWMQTSLPVLSEKDYKDIDFGLQCGVDFIAVSFTRSADEIKSLRHYLNDRERSSVKIIAKIECVEGLKHYNEIIAAADAIMVARGDLGRELPPEKVFLAQKYMVREANIYGKPIIVATQFLESMVYNPRPTRAECGDVANAVYDGCDCVMLGAETAIGNFPVQSVRMIARTCCEAESTVNHNTLYESVRGSSKKRFGHLTNAESIASSAVKTAYDVDAKIIVVFSESGTTAKNIAKFRPGMPICVITPSAIVARQCFGLFKGVYAFIVEDLDDTNKLIQDTTNEVRLAGIAKEGDPFVLVCGNTFGRGATNQIKVEIVQSDYWDMPAEHLSSAHFVGRHDEHGCVIS